MLSTMIMKLLMMCMCDWRVGKKGGIFGITDFGALRHQVISFETESLNLIPISRNSGFQLNVVGVQSSKNQTVFAISQALAR